MTDQKRCMHIGEGWKAMTAVRHVSLPGMEGTHAEGLDTLTALCPLCTGYIIGTLSRMETHGIQTPDEQLIEALRKTIEAHRAMVEARDAQIALMMSLLKRAQ